MKVDTLLTVLQKIFRSVGGRTGASYTRKPTRNNILKQIASYRSQKRTPSMKRERTNMV